MGEAKRRKQLLGSRYGKPLGLSSAERINLIERNMARWIAEHFENCDYYNYLEKPFSSQIRNTGCFPSNLEEVVEDVTEHWQSTFDREYPNQAIKLLISAILKDRPIVFEGVGLKPRQKLEPIITLPSARKYLQKQVKTQKIPLSTHYILVKEALIVLGKKTQAPLLKQLLWGELNEVILSAQEERPSWLTKNTDTDGWLDLSEEVVFQSINRAMAGILTILATLPWSMQLDFIL